MTLPEAHSRQKQRLREARAYAHRSAAGSALSPFAAIGAGVHYGAQVVEL